MIHYKKIQSNGNNFLLLDNRNLNLESESISRYAIRDCDIKKGIGADGLLVLENSDCAEFRMRIFNSNGFESEMCGNGARCIALYAYDHKIALEKMHFETLSGIIYAEVSGVQVKITLGTYNINPSLDLQQTDIHEETLYYQFLTIGVPHVVVFLEDNKTYTKAEMKLIGAALDTNHRLFQSGTNVNFVKKINNGSESIDQVESHSDLDKIEVITYERGVEDITDSCGTGSCASAILASIRYHLTSPIEVINIGGINRVYFIKNNHQVEIQLEGEVYYSGNIECAILNQK